MLTDTAALSGAPTQLYLDGGFTTASNDAVFEVEDPATGQLLAEVSDARRLLLSL